MCEPTYEYQARSIHVYLNRTHTYINKYTPSQKYRTKNAQETLGIIRGVFFFPTLCCLILFFLNIS